ncbi:DUF4351 domain-containing protein [Halanaerobacter jeridensis]|uniref:DUF4351 domain-containing protein n=1 Tax=Halanaerobacter jeridensis TaxID=706427 RepID=A0A938XV44_9FIRM|nr:DUF4351 domain-containing protein [Halanaerobacter jeridensis]MBM7558085.1 hypothetical protein [Halanaerobacter jeridensis]
MINKKQLVKKLHYKQGFNADEIAELLEEPENEIQRLIDNFPQYQIPTINNTYSFNQITDKEHYNLRKKSLSIKPMHMFSFEMDNYLQRFELQGLPEIYAILSYFFGKSSKSYDDYKCSFSYKFRLEFSSPNGSENEYEYLISIIDIKGNHTVRFYKIDEDRDKEDYDTFHRPFPELPRKEMEKIWFWFIAFVKNGLEIINDNNLAIKPFCRKIPAINLFYGYKDEQFFIKEYRNNNDHKKALANFRNDYEQYQQQIKKLLQNNNYQNHSSKYISEVIEETNEISLPYYEFDKLNYQIFKFSYDYFRKLDSCEQDELGDKADSMKSDLLYYLSFKNNYESKQEYLAEVDDDKDLKKAVEKIDFYLQEKNDYTAEEIDQILEIYRANFREGQKEAALEMIKNTLSDKFTAIPEQYIEKLKQQSLKQLEKILLAAFEMDCIKELEEYLI